MSIEELKEEALRLAPAARANLARILLASLDVMSDKEIEALWLEEAIRREENIEKGVAQVFPADEVLARARSHRK